MDEWKEQYSSDPEAIIQWIKAAYLMADGDWCECIRRVAKTRDADITRLRAELAVARSELAVSVGHLSRLAEAYGCENFSSAIDATFAAEGEGND